MVGDSFVGDMEVKMALTFAHMKFQAELLRIELLVQSLRIEQGRAYTVMQDQRRDLNVLGLTLTVS
jgi:hypothetical protein